MKTLKKLPLMDIYLSSYLVLNGINAELILEGTRVIFEFPATDEVLKFSRDFNSNSLVPVLDYVRAIRQNRARMFSMKGDL